MKKEGLLIDLMSTAIVVFSLFGAIHAVDLITMNESLSPFVMTLGCAIPGAVMFLDALALFMIASGRLSTEIEDKE